MFIAIVALSACHGPVIPADIQNAQSLERGGDRDPEALEAWRHIAAERCPARREAATTNRYLERSNVETLRKDDCGTAGLRVAQILERQHHDAEAADAYEQVASSGAGNRNAARGLAEATRLREELNETDRALDDARRCVTEFGDESGADDALDRWVRIERKRKGDLGALRSRLDELAHAHLEADSADNLIFAAADLSEKDLNDPDGAIARWDELAARWRYSTLRDDSLWRAADLLKRRGDFRGALERLKKIIDTKQTAWITGSYNSVWLDDAQLLAGRIELDELHEPKEAARYFLDLADKFKDSILRDDALFELARARLAMNDHAGACAALARLLKQYPDGNMARKAAERSTELGCH